MAERRVWMDNYGSRRGARRVTFGLRELVQYEPGRPSDEQGIARFLAALGLDDTATYDDVEKALRAADRDTRAAASAALTGRDGWSANEILAALRACGWGPAPVSASRQTSASKQPADTPYSDTPRREERIRAAIAAFNAEKSRGRVVLCSRRDYINQMLRDDGLPPLSADEQAAVERGDPTAREMVIRDGRRQHKAELARGMTVVCDLVSFVNCRLRDAGLGPVSQRERLSL